MSTPMPETPQDERLRWVLPVINNEIRLKDTLCIFPYGARTLKRWLAAYRTGGADALVPKSTRPKSHPKETPIRTKERVLEKRSATKLCAKKIHWRLKKEGLVVPVSTIGKILKDEGVTRAYRVKKVKYKYLRAQRQPGELFEIDVKYVPGPIADKRYFQYTAIDTASRWRYLRVFDEQSTYHTLLFLQDVQSRFPHRIHAVKTDNHSTFTNYYTGTNKRSDQTVKTLHPLDVYCREQGMIHYLIDPGRPAQNGTIERSHREDQEKFYEQNTFTSLSDLEHKIRVWNEYYNNLEHCGLHGKTPNEMLQLQVPNVVS